MCTGLELLMAAGSTIGAASTISTANRQKKDAQQARTKAADAEAERQTAAAQATQNAYAERQWARRARAENSLFTGGGGDAAAGTRQTMGV